MTATADFVGPLDAADQAWSDQVLAADRAAVASEPVELVIRRRQTSIAEFHRAAALLMLTGQTRAAQQVGLGAVAEARALAELVNRPPAPLVDDYDCSDRGCIDCIAHGRPCPLHTGHPRSTDTHAGEPGWHRFGR